MLVADVDFAHFFSDFVPDTLSPVATNTRTKELAPATLANHPPPSVPSSRSTTDVLNLNPAITARRRHSLVGTAKAHPVPLHLRGRAGLGLAPPDPTGTHTATTAPPFALTIPDDDAQAAQDETDADAQWRQERKARGKASEAEVALRLDCQGAS